jgi:hypothetical protein
MRLSGAAREQLIRLRRRPEEKPATNALLIELQRSGHVVARPLMRPSGAPSRYREWSITPHGLQALQVAR